MTRIGILGAGALGRALARMAVAAGHEVRIAGSGDPKFIALSVQIEAPGAIATTSEDAVADAGLAVLAVPLHRVHDLPPLGGLTVVDAMNYWAAVDGELPEFADHPGGTSVAVASALVGARLVKSLNHVSAADLLRHSRDQRRVAIGVASNHEPSAHAVVDFVSQLGFEPVAIGGLDRGVELQPGSAVFGHALTREAFLRAVSG